MSNSGRCDPGSLQNLKISRVSLDKDASRRSLAEFLRLAWPALEPATPLVWGFHLEAICEHLAAVTAGQIRNLAITVPPGTTKSILVSVLWPAWQWGPARQPHLKFLCASNDMALTLRDAVSCRRLIESDWYRERWGHVFKLTSDQNIKSWYENDARGYRTSTSRDSRVTGKKGDILIGDDLDDAQQVCSDAYREAGHEWFRRAFYNRVNDLATGRRVLVGQRTHPEDLIGIALETGAFEELRIPEQFDSTRRCRTSIGWTDPRKVDGELLRPQRFGDEQVREARKLLGDLGYESIHQQNPRLRDGDMFQVGRIEIIDREPPQIVRQTRYWDHASTPGAGDYTVGLRLGYSAWGGGQWVILDVVRGQWDAHERDRVMRQTAEVDGGAVKQKAQREPGSGGKDQGDAFVRLMAGFRVEVESSTASKVARADPVSSQVNGGQVKMLRAPWNRVLLDELRAFPHGAHDDQVDCLAGAFNDLAASPAPGPIKTAPASHRLAATKAPAGTF